MADTPDPAAVETVMRVLGCESGEDVQTGDLYCVKHRHHWMLGKFDACPDAYELAREVVAALDLDTRDRAAEKRGAAAALRAAASDLSRLADHGADDEASPYESADWLRARANRIEAGEVNP